MDLDALGQEIKDTRTKADIERDRRDNIIARAAGPDVTQDQLEKYNKQLAESRAKEAKLREQTVALTNVFKAAADVTREKSIVEKKLLDIQKGKQQMKGAVSDFAFGTNQSRMAGAQSMARAEFAAQRGSAEVVPEKFRADLKATLDKFSKAKVFAGGTKTGEEVKAEMESNAVRQRATFIGQQKGLKGKNLQDFVGKTVENFEEGRGDEEKMLIEELRDLQKVEQKFAQFQMDQQQQLQNELYTRLNQFIKDLRTQFFGQGQPAGANAPAPQQATATTTEHSGNIAHTHTLVGGEAVGSQVAQAVVATVVPQVEGAIANAIPTIQHDSNGNHVPSQGTANNQGLANRANQATVDSLRAT